MKQLITFAFISLATISFIGCDSSEVPDNTTDNNSEFLSSSKQRNLSPDATNSEIAELAHGNTTFAFELYKEIQDEPGNLFYSPFSISMALAMTYTGARGETKTQMADTMRFTLADDRQHIAFNAVDLALESRGQEAQGQDGEGFRLKVVNATWGLPDYPFQNQFLDVMMVNYGAGMRLLDFINQPDDSRIKINDWVEETTENKIKDLIPYGLITSDTRLVLTNAIYFNAAWESQFEEDGTYNRLFNRLGGSKVSVPMMNQIANFDYFVGNNFEIIELLYEGKELSMLIVAPDIGSFDKVEDNLSTDFINGIISSLEPKLVKLTMPKFEFESDLTLKMILENMGMVDAFSSTLSDFSGIDGGYDPGLHISEVVHKAFVAVNEKGTEAAAATAVISDGGSMPQYDVNLMLDRPFLFLIRDIKTNTVLFLGRMADPS